MDNQENSQQLNQTTTPQNTEKKKEGCFWIGVVALLFLCVIGVVVIAGGLIFAVASGGFAERMETLASTANSNLIEEHIEGSIFAKDKIAVIDIRGVITSAPAASGSIYELACADIITEQIKRAATDASVKAIIINLDTPGGEVTASDVIYNEIMKARKEHNVPVVAYMNSLAASGGYYSAVACDKIVANRLTLTGSIGVIMETYNYHELFNKIGVKSEIYKSGKMKDILDGSRPRTEGEIQIIQNLVNNCYSEFVKVVSLGRKIPIETIRTTEIGDGRVFDGEQALKLKLVDSLGYFEDATKLAAQLAGTNIESVKLVRYSEAFSLSRLLREMKGVSKPLNVNLQPGAPDASIIKKGRMYFLPEML